jgi:UPF0716 protein FxsA
LLVVLFILLPIAEIWFIIEVGQLIGPWWTIALLIGLSVAGAWLVKWQGIFTLARMRGELMRGRMPTNQLVDGALILVAGALMLTPGFITDIFGIMLLLPPVRAVLRAPLVKRVRARVLPVDWQVRSGPGDAGGPVIDV